jgi:protein-S-isoprenylcysteine O-methyltransferase Ste14
MKQASGALIGSVVASLLYLGLAIWGRGGFAAFFAVPALTAIAVATMGLVVVGLFSPVNLSSGEREDRGNRWPLIVLGIIGLAGAYLPAYTDRINFWTLSFDGIRWLGVVIFLAGGVLRLWPIFILQQQFSGLVAIQSGHRLRTTGIYSVIRHPSYLGIVVNALGWGLVFRSSVGILLALLNIPPLIARIQSEEKMLAFQFGSEYEAYRAHTSRFIPGIY